MSRIIHQGSYKGEKCVQIHYCNQEKDRIIWETDLKYPHITEIEKKVLSIRYGFTAPFSVHTYEQTGKVLNYSGQRIRQIEEKALLRLELIQIVSNMPDFSKQEK